MGPPRTLGARLRELRERHFVGRAPEVAMWHAALEADPPPFAVLHLHGPGGVGKTTLLQRFAREAEAAGRVVAVIDGHSTQPTPEGFLRALKDAEPTVLLVDTYERLTALDEWLREELLPRLPDGALVVLAGRRPPLPAWRADPAWRELSCIVTLRDLAAADAHALLAGRGVAAEAREPMVAFAGGHPLALTLMADLARQGARAAAAGPDVDVVRALVDRFVDHVPDAEHREALAVCALARVTTETLLRTVLPQAPAQQLFDWLCELSFVELSGEGVFPHDLARDAIDAELRWRDPQRHRELYAGVARATQRRAQDATGRARDRAYLDLLHLQRFDPEMREYFLWERINDTWLQPAGPADHAAVLELAAASVPGTRELAAYWLARQPEAFDLFRAEEEQEPIGFAAHLLLSDRLEQHAAEDPGLAAIAAHVARHGPLREGEQVCVTRLWAERGGGQSVATHHLIATRATAHWADTPRLAWTFAVVADTELWAPMFAASGLPPAPDAAFEIGGHRFGVFALDWRRLPYARWARGERRAAEGTPVLTQAAFAAAVRDALRAYARPDLLAGNPLLGCRLLAGARDEERPERLRALLREAAAGLDTHPRDQKFHRALDVTYFRPAPTQEAAADRLGLPFSTYRRHLGAGIERVTAALWAREVG